MEVDFNRAFGFGEVLPQGCFEAFCGFFVPIPIVVFLADLFRLVRAVVGCSGFMRADDSVWHNAGL